MMKAKTQFCDLCKRHYYEGDVLRCREGHKPRFYMPKRPYDTDWGWKRVCEDYEDSDQNKVSKHEPH